MNACAAKLPLDQDELAFQLIDREARRILDLSFSKTRHCILERFDQHARMLQPFACDGPVDLGLRERLQLLDGAAQAHLELRNAAEEGVRAGTHDWRMQLAAFLGAASARHASAR